MLAPPPAWRGLCAPDAGFPLVGYASLVPDESSRSQITPLAKRVARWRPHSNRQRWLVVAVPVILECAAAIAIPEQRSALVAGVPGLVLAGWMSSESRSSRRAHEALASRLSAHPRDDIPAGVIDLLVAGKRIQAIKRYSKMTGISLKEAQDLINTL